MRKSKVMLTILAAAMAASLTACGGSSDKGAATTAAAAGGSDTKTEAAGSTASADAINFTMSLVDNTSSNYYKGAEKIAECVEKATDGTSSRHLHLEKGCCSKTISRAAVPLSKIVHF